MNKIFTLFCLILHLSIQAQVGLPVWPIAPYAGLGFQTIDWQQNPPETNALTPTSFQIGSVGSAFNGCGDLIFYAAHTGTAGEDKLFIFRPDNTTLLSSTTPNAPGLNAVKGNHELQVIPVPETPDEWYIIYSEYSSDSGAPAGDASYNAARLLYSRVQSNGVYLDVLERDILLTVNGNDYTYNDGRAVSADANGNENAHFLYAARRSVNNPNISVDKFLISNTGIIFIENTGDTNVGYWSFTHQGSSIEASQDGNKLAVLNRNESLAQPDLLVYDLNNFNAANAEVIFIQDLFLVADGQPIDQSDTLPLGGFLSDIASDQNQEFRWLENLPHKVSNVEWSPNGQFLYLSGGGYPGDGLTHISYLMQVNLTNNPPEIRLQVQQPPSNGYNILTGQGCPSTNAACSSLWQRVGRIQTAFDGELYFNKRLDSILYIIPNANEIMPQNLVSSNIDLSTLDQQNIDFPFDIRLLPEQMDGFDYLQINFAMIDTLTTDTFACLGSSIDYQGTEIFTGDTLYIAGLLNACDTVLEIIVNPFPDTETSEEFTICAGETIDIFGEEVGISGSYSMDFSSVIGCDSTHTIVLNILPEIEINFDIIPTCLGESSGEMSATVTGGAPPYSYAWSTGDNSNTINELSVDTYTLTVTDDNNCTQEKDADIGLTGASGFTIETTDVNCFGDTNGSLLVQTLNEELSFSLDGISYSQNTTFNNLVPNTYTVFVQDAAGCIYVEEALIIEPDLLTIVLPRDTLLRLGSSLIINPTLSRNDSLTFLWTPAIYLNCDTCLQTISTPFQSTIYTLTAQDTFGCSAFESMQIAVNSEREIFMPNAFSPNNDGVNDVLYPFGNESVVQVSSFRIYDRWGNLLHDKINFSIDDNDFGWDGFFGGKRMQTGVYIYVLEVNFIDGDTVIFKGNVNLL